MKRLKILKCTILVLAVLIMGNCLWISQTVKADLLETYQDEQGMHRMKMCFKLSPKPIEQPLLKYRFYWMFNERNTDNAANHYNRAYIELQRVTGHKSTDLYRDELAKIWDALEHDETVDLKFLESITPKRYIAPEDGIQEDWTPEEVQNRHREEFLTAASNKAWEYSYFSQENVEENLESLKAFVANASLVYENLELASHCENCDFGLPFRETNNPIAVRLEEIQDMRELARVLNAKIILEIHEGRYEDAVKSIRIGMVMAQHTAKQPYIVSGLVGIAIQGIMQNHLWNMISRPDCPNLYWAIANQPNPVFSPIDGLQTEQTFVLQTFPLLKKATDHPDLLSEHEWKEMLEQIFEWVKEYAQEYSPFAPTGKFLSMDKTAVSSAVMATYPNARRWLREQGKIIEEIDAMSPEKVVGQHTAFEVQCIWDSCFRQMYLPLWEMTNEDSDFQNYNKNVFAKMLSDLFLPAIEAAKSAYARAQFTNDMLRIAEAVRCCAAENGGKLPESLEEITEIPIPMVNPFTGKPYEYKVENGIGQIREVPTVPPTNVFFEMEKSQ